MVNDMSRNISDFLTSNKIVRTVLIIIICILLLSAFLLRSEISNFLLKFESYTNKDVQVTKDILMRDIVIIKAKEGVQGQVVLLKNDNKDLHKLEDELFLDKNKGITDGKIIHVAINNRMFTNAQQPVEIRFMVRMMLYLRERETAADVGNVVGIAGGFNRNAIERFEGSQLIKMSVEEFEELYNEIDISGFDTEKQIDALTDLWINKTGYWRRGLFGKEESNYK